MGLSKEQYQRIMNRIELPYECDEAEALIKWCREGHYPFTDLIYHIKNEQDFTNESEAVKIARIKRDIARGINPGMLDYCLPVPLHGWPSLIIELKRLKHGRLSDAQKEMIPRLKGVGNLVVVCKGAKEAIESIVKYYEGRF